MYRTAVCAFLLVCIPINGFAIQSATADEPTAQIDVYRQFALEHSGNAAAGEELYRKEKKLACVNCHNITGAEKNGPNLDGIQPTISAARFDRKHPAAQPVD